jgi:DivIVA domain-containing protein
MGQLLLLLVVALTVAAVVFGVTVLVTGNDPGLVPAEPDGRAVPLPGTRPLLESDVADVRFDTTVRGYRMTQVDQAMRRAAYDIGYKDELIGVLEAEVIALREGRTADAEALRQAREAALAPADPSTLGTPEHALEAGVIDRHVAGEPPAAGAEGAALDRSAAQDQPETITEQPAPTAAEPAPDAAGESDGAGRDSVDRRGPAARSEPA